MRIRQLIQTLAAAATLLLAHPLQAETYYFHNDHLGTPQALTDSDGTVVWQGRYKPFGEVTETVDTVEQNIRFPGQYFEEETGLHYNYFRDYDPSIGRYIESDPIGLRGGVNTYLYANGSPTRYYDSDGLRPCPDINGCLAGCHKFYRNCMQRASQAQESCLRSLDERCENFSDPGAKAGCLAAAIATCEIYSSGIVAGCHMLLGACTAACIFPTGDTPCNRCEGKR